ncbi:hypothetical protein D3C80_1979020 [compost metagenome]
MHFQKFILIRFRFALLQILCQIQMNDLICKTRGGVKGMKERDLTCCITRLFLQLPLCSFKRIFTFLKLASRNLQLAPPQRCTELVDQ